MRKTYRKKRKKPKLRYWANERIRAPKVRLIDENGQMLGVMSTREALEIAKKHQLDLVEISPKAEPPVAKIMDFGSFKYQQDKILQKQKAKQKKTETKGIRLSTRIGKHDMETRLSQAKKFLDKGNKLKIELVLRGREHKHIAQAFEIINQFIDLLVEDPDYDIIFEQNPKKEGSRLSAIVYNKTQ